MGNRAIHLVLVLLIVTFGTMLLVDLVPGGIAYSILGDSATPEQVARINRELNLDASYLDRYTTWIGNVLSGDLGASFKTGRSVLDTIGSRLSVTVELLILTQVLALVLSIPIGLYAAQREGGLFDRSWSVISSAMISVPPFVLALVLSYFFAVQMQLFPVVGWTPISGGLGENLKSLVLPALALAAGEIAMYSRVLRSDAVSTMRNDYMLAARSRGLAPSRLLFRHALRPSSLSLVTLGALSLGRLIGGSVVVEVVFGLPGIGSLMIDSVLNSDLIVVQGIVLLVALAFVVANILIDLAYGYLDPRVRKGAV
ncbi:ABC transporter permease [Nocardioides sp. cx-169]|uniref:ABC transporter permease n=1 Tax=Nocardioides sp. cx-169 TaxID=2899080 RepID=UPI001E2ADA38|nr:ABC transporter permease [Nocardioides sp. cx-169]MCD4533078.1 ABC transporter permease [Nocardioides sp. cx-169]